MVKGLFKSILFLFARNYVPIHALDNGLGLKPLLGWNTWKTCGDSDCTHDYCDEHEVKTAAEATRFMECATKVFSYEESMSSLA